MNKQFSDLTGLVLALTEKLSSNVGEGNNQSTASDKTCARSDNRATLNNAPWQVEYSGLLDKLVCNTGLENF